MSDLNYKNELVVWNIGQGQWITWSDYETCIHFDIGGEKIPWEKIMNLCQGKTNKIVFSHKDKDHTQWAYSLFKKAPKHTCLLTQITTPPYPVGFKNIPQCQNREEYKSWQKLKPPKNIRIKDYNFHSEVVHFKKFLFTGDASQKAEKYWAGQIINNDLIKVLILGHHGSKTSTSKLLLNNLPKLNQCVSSSREARYGHPNKETLKRIKEKNCPHLNTGRWGHIHFTY
jgi:competence protein ComEC